MTPVSSTPIRRICPTLVQGDRPLVVSLDDAEGGSIHLEWKGRPRMEPVTVSLAELMDYAEGHGVPGVAEPQPRGKGITTDDLLSRAHVIPCESMATRLALIALIKDLDSHNRWVASGAAESWETWQKKNQQPTE